MNINYYHLFNLVPTFEIDLKKLSKKFHLLQKKYHPDLNINYCVAQHKERLKKSVVINKGYHTLKNPLKRAKYLLYLNGFLINRNDNLHTDSTFLKHQFELYEKLDFFKKNVYTLKKYNLFLKDIYLEEKKYFSNFSMHCSEFKWNLAKCWLIKLIFIEKIKKEITKMVNNFAHM